MPSESASGPHTSPPVRSWALASSLYSLCWPRPGEARRSSVEQEEQAVRQHEAPELEGARRRRIPRWALPHDLAVQAQAGEPPAHLAAHREQVVLEEDRRVHLGIELLGRQLVQLLRGEAARPLLDLVHRASGVVAARHEHPPVANREGRDRRGDLDGEGAAPQQRAIGRRHPEHAVHRQVEELLDAADGRGHDGGVRHHVAGGLGVRQSLLPRGLVERDDERIAAGGDDQAGTIEQRVLADVPPRNRGLVFLDQVLLPDELAGLRVERVEPGLGIEREHELRPDGRHRACDAVVGADVDRVAPAPEVLAVRHREAADPVRLLLDVVVVQVEPASANGGPGVAFADGRFPEHLGPPGRPRAEQAGFGRDVVAVGAAELWPFVSRDS